MRTIPREVPNVMEPRRDYTPAPVNSVTKAYLQGALHDSTYNTCHRSVRFSQANKEWLLRLQKMFKQLGHKSWIYREGRKRNVFALETTAKFLDYDFNPLRLKKVEEQRAYVRGYFDAEGGFPKSLKVRLYIQFSQKDLKNLERLHSVMQNLNIKCGKIHNPSIAVDKDYFRFYVRAQSHMKFMREIGSDHPRKWKDIIQRMKI